MKLGRWARWQRPAWPWAGPGRDEAHLRICASPEWAAYVETELLPWALGDAELGDEVAEVGPRLGLTTDRLRRRVPRVTAVEIDGRLAQALAERLSGSKVRVLHGDGTSLPFSGGQFSAVTLFTMLHHVPSVPLQDRHLAEVRRVLRPGGLVVGTEGMITPGRGCVRRPVPVQRASRMIAANWQVAPAQTKAWKTSW